MSKNDAPNELQRLLYAAFRKKIRNLSEVRKFSERANIPFNTVRNYFYKSGAIGISATSEILTALFNVDESKVAAIIDLIDRTKPIPKSRQIWNSIKADEERRIYYAMVAKAIWEIERDPNKK